MKSLVYLFILLPFSLFPQVVPKWDVALTSDFDLLVDMKSDASGNVYLLGQKTNSTLDIVVVKYNSSGRQWAKTYDSGQDDEAYALGLDVSGNAYVAASFDENGSNRFAGLVLKYTSSGTQSVATYNHGSDSYSEKFLDGFHDGTYFWVVGYQYNGAINGTDIVLVRYSSALSSTVATYNESGTQAAYKIQGSGSTLHIGGLTTTNGAASDVLYYKYSTTSFTTSTAPSAKSSTAASWTAIDKLSFSGNNVAMVADAGASTRLVMFNGSTWKTVTDSGIENVTDVMVDGSSVYLTGQTFVSLSNQLVFAKFSISSTARTFLSYLEPKPGNSNHSAFSSKGISIYKNASSNYVVLGNLVLDTNPNDGNPALNVYVGEVEFNASGVQQDWSIYESSGTEVKLAFGNTSNTYLAGDTQLWVMCSPPIVSIADVTEPFNPSGNSIQLDAGAGFESYSWSSGGSSRYTTVTQSGTYTVTVTNVNGCEASDASLVTITPIGQTITFNTPFTPFEKTMIIDGNPFEITATSTSGLTVTFGSSNTGVASVADHGNGTATVTLVSGGTSTISAYQSGNANYTAASSVSHLLTVNKATNTVEFPMVNDMELEQIQTINGNEFVISSGNYPTSVTSSDPTKVSVEKIGDSFKLTAHAIGMVTLTATVPTDGSYLEGQGEVQLTVSKKSQQIEVSGLNIYPTYGDSPFDFTASATSGLALQISSSDETVLTIQDNTANYSLVFVGGGTAELTISQSGNDEFAAAVEYVKSVTVEKKSQEISFEGIAYQYLSTGSVDLSASSNSGLEIVFINLSSDIVTLTEANSLEFVTSGSVTIKASQSGNANYHAALDVEQNFQIYDDVPPQLTAVSSQDITATGFSVKIASEESVSVYVMPLVKDSDPPTSSTVKYGTSINKMISYPDFEIATFSNMEDQTTYEVYVVAEDAFDNLMDQPIKIEITTLDGTPPIITVDKTLSSEQEIDYSISLNEAGTLYYVLLPGGSSALSEGEIKSATPLNGQAILESSSLIFSFQDEEQVMMLTSVVRNQSYDLYLYAEDTSENGSPVIVKSFLVPDETPPVFVSGTPYVSATTPTSFAFTIDVDEVSDVYYVVLPRLSEVPSEIQVQNGTDASGNSGLSFGSIASSQVMISQEIFNLEPGTFYDVYLYVEDVYGNGSEVRLLNAATQDVISFSNDYGIKRYGDESFSLTASALSGLPIQFTSSNTEVATISEGILTVVGVGSSDITAARSGVSEIPEPEPVSYTFDFAKGLQTITDFNAPNSAVFGDPDYTLSAKGGDSGNQVTFASLEPSIASISGNILSIHVAGTVTIYAHQAGSDLYEEATSSEVLTIERASQSIVLPELPNVYFNYTNEIDPLGTASSGLAIIYEISGPAYFNLNDNIQLSGELGTVTVTATQPGNSNFHPAPEVSASFEVIKAPQEIVFEEIPEKIFGDDTFGLVAVGGGSESPISFHSSNLLVATVEGKIVTIVGAGQSTVTASQAGDDYYDSALEVEQLLVVAKSTQTIIWSPIPDKLATDVPFEFEATATSGLELQYMISGPATFSGTTITLTGDLGLVTLSATQSGDSNYLPATSSLTFNVNDPGKSNQTISFEPISNKVFGENPFTISASSSSELPIIFNVLSGPILLEGNLVTLTGAGTASISANQYGNEYFHSAAEIIVSFIIAKAEQHVFIEAIEDKRIDDEPFDIQATTTSGLSLSYEVEGPALLSGTTITLAGESGVVQIKVLQAGDDNYHPASTTLTFNVYNPAKINQTIAFEAIADKVFGDGSFNVFATASSDLNVVFNVIEGPIVLTASSVTITGAGIATIAANQPGNEQYNAAPQVIRNFLISKASQILTVEPIDDKFVSDPAFEVMATTTSGLSLTYDITGPAILQGTTITLTGESGIVQIEVLQAGDDNYHPASTTLTFNVYNPAKINQTIAFEAIADKVFGDGSFNVFATASSDLNVVFNVIEGPIVLTASSVSITGAGIATIAANQPGNEQYNAAPQVIRNFLISKASQILTVEPIDDKFVSDPAFEVMATTTSGLSLTYDITGPAILQGTTITLTGESGIVQIEVLQAGDDNYHPASTTLTFNVYNPAKINQTIAFEAISDKVYGEGSFDLFATSNSGLEVVFNVIEGPIVLTATSVSITGAGIATIAANQSGNEQYNAAPQVIRNFLISKASQILTVEPIDDKLVSDPAFEVMATITSGLSLTYDITGPAILQGTTITLTGESGIVQIEVLQAGDDNYHPASTTLTFNVNNPAKINQTIAFEAISDKVYGEGSFDLFATSNSGLEVVFSVIDGPIVLNATSVSITGAGIATIAANQSGNEQYHAASQVIQSFEISKATQSITISPIPDKLTTDPAFNVEASASSGLELTMIVSGPATNSDNVITLSGEVGTVTVIVTQSGNANFLSTSEDITFEVIDPLKSNQTITFNALASKIYGDPSFELLAISSSGLSVAYTSSNTDVALITGNSVTLVGAGEAVIAAAQLGDGSFNPAITVNRVLVVSKATLIAQASSHLVTYGEVIPELSIDYKGFVNGDSSDDIDTYPTANTVATSTTDVGVYPIEVSGGTDNNYEFDYAEGTIIINKAEQTIDFGFIDNVDISMSTQVALGATCSSGLEVSYLLIEGSGEITINELTLLETGTFVVVATQNGNQNYNEAVPVTQSFDVFDSRKADQMITFDAIGTKQYGDSELDIHAVTSSGLEVSFSSSHPEVAIISGAKLTIIGAGETLIVASQAGNEEFNSAKNVSQTLAVDKALLTVSAIDLTMIEGEDLPDFELVYSGFVNDEDQSVLDQQPTIQSAVTPESGTGIYEILLEGGQDNNYQFELVNGTLTIVEAQALLSVIEPELLNVFPNPTYRKIRVQATESVILDLFDSSGQWVLSGLTNQDIDLSPLSSGIYFIKVSNKVFRVIKQR